MSWRTRLVLLETATPIQLLCKFLQKNYYMSHHSSYLLIGIKINMWIIGCLFCRNVVFYHSEDSLTFTFSFYRENLKVGVGTTHRAESCTRGGWVMDAVVTLCDSPNQTDPSPMECCSQTEVCLVYSPYFRRIQMNYHAESTAS